MALKNLDLKTVFFQNFIQKNSYLSFILIVNALIWFKFSSGKCHWIKQINPTPWCSAINLTGKEMQEIINAKDHKICWFLWKRYKTNIMKQERRRKKKVLWGGRLRNKKRGKWMWIKGEKNESEEKLKKKVKKIKF